MPKPSPIPAETRRRIASRISMGAGRNQIAREFGISTGVVSKIARENRLYFENTGAASVATQARQIDQWAARVDREDELLRAYLALTKTQRDDGTPTREEKRLSYALYNVNRHHKGQYR
jgi:transposase-like protein